METLQKGCESEQSSSFAQSDAATEIAPAIPFQQLNEETKGGNNFPGVNFEENLFDVRSNLVHISYWR